MLLTANTARLTDVPSSGHYFFLFFSEDLDSVSKKKKKQEHKSVPKTKSLRVNKQPRLLILTQSLEITVLRMQT
jgi:hypothetical protein